MPAILPAIDFTLYEYYLEQKLGTNGPGQDNKVRRLRRKLGLLPDGWVASYYPSTGTGSAVNSPPGTIVLIGDGVNVTRIDQQVFGLTIGKRYYLRFTASGQPLGTVRGGTVYGAFDVIPATPVGTGSKTVSFIAKSTSMFIRFHNNTTTPLTISNVY